jgi:hypothetical protein
MRIGVALVTFLLAVSAVADTREEALAREIQQRVGKPLREINCPGDEWWKAGATIDCAAWARGDGAWIVRVHIIDDQRAEVLSVEKYEPPPRVEQPRAPKSYALPLAAAAVFLAILIAAIANLVTLFRRAQIAPRLELKPQQPVFFGEPGSYTLWVEGPRFTREMDRVEPMLWDPRAARWLTLPRPVRMYVAGITNVRYARAAINIEQPGEYVLALSGLDPAKAPYASKLLLARSTIVRQALTTVAIVFSGIGLIGAVIVAAS